MPNRALKVEAGQFELPGIAPSTDPAAGTGVPLAAGGGSDPLSPQGSPRASGGAPREAVAAEPLAGEEAMVRAFNQLRAAVREAAQERDPAPGSDGVQEKAAGAAGDEVLAAATAAPPLREDALFDFGPGSGQVFLSGGAGWTEVVRLHDAGGAPGPDGWTLHLEAGTATEVDGAILLSEDAAGCVRLRDGSELAFEGIERIEW